MRKIILMGVMGVVMAGSSYSMTNSGLIMSGLDTILTNKLFGFDFLTQTACTSSSNYPGCYQHFDFQNYNYAGMPDYELESWPGGYGIKMGKMNFDSIKTAPSDSIFYLNERGKVDRITSDSLSSRIGNVYLLKTPTDPRDKYPYYAKIKIIKFIVLDSASHSIKMVFLWAANISGYQDLHTSGLDTFHLEPPLLTHDNNLSVTRTNHQLTTAVFKVATGKFTLPLVLQVPNSFLAVYDLSGKQLGRVSAGNSRVIDLRQFGAGRGVVVVRVER